MVAENDSETEHPDAHSQRPDDLETWATGRLLSTAARLVEHAWDAHLAAYDLNHASFAVLWSLAGGPMSQRELATGHQVEDQTMSRVVERMERAGYVTRVRSSLDRRRMEVTVTPAGLRAARAAAAGDSAERMLLAALSPDQNDALRDHLVTLVRTLGSRRWS